MSSDVDVVISGARRAGYRVLFALNVGIGTAATAADEAAYIYQNGSDVLEGFEIGNEPDFFCNNGLRPAGYSVTDYIAEYTCRIRRRNARQHSACGQRGAVHLPKRRPRAPAVAHTAPALAAPAPPSPLSIRLPPPPPGCQTPRSSGKLKAQLISWGRFHD
jgi:hypothetical protein